MAIGNGSGAGDPSARFVGRRVHRREDPRLLTGRGEFIADVTPPGVAHAAFVRSPLASASIASIDTAEAQALPGVLAVLTGAELNGIPEALWNNATPGFEFPDVRPLAGEDVRFAGDPVAVVIAESRYIAEDACELVAVDYRSRPAVVGIEQALRTELLVHPNVEGNTAWTGASAEDPQLSAAFEASEYTFEETFHQQRYLAVPIETRGIVVRYDASSGEITIWTATQTPHADRVFFSRVLGLPEHRVRVITKDVGGGFGQKYYNSREEAAIAMAAMALGRPVKWIEDRQENLMAATSSREESMTIRIGVSGDGVIGAVRISHAANIGAYPQNSTAGGRMVASVFPGPYRIPHFGWEATSVYTNTCGRSAYRGPWLMETVGREMMLEIVARELGIDPAELRRRNMIASHELPYTTVTGAVYRGISSAEVFERALETADYDEFRRVQARERERGRYLGIGIASFVEPTALGGSPYHAEVATVRVEAGGTVTVLMGTGSTGNSIETTIAQVVADQLGVEVEDVRVHQGDTAVSPAGSGTGGSRSALAAGGVARICATKTREKVLAIAAHMLEASEDDLQLAGGVIAVKGSPGASLTLAQVATAAYTDPSKLPEGMEMGLEVTSRYNPPPMTHSDATHICMCEVDVHSGVVTLLDYVVGEDCGVLINPMVVEGQIAGGVAQGIGGALLENMAHDDHGNPLAITFKDYLLPTTMDVPDIRYAHLETPSDTPGGHKGMAEGSAIGSPPAVSNAIADALAPFHVRVTTHPLDPDRILELLAAAS